MLFGVHVAAMNSIRLSHSMQPSGQAHPVAIIYNQARLSTSDARTLFREERGGGNNFILSNYVSV